jgi:hypothetical protein
MGTAAIVGMAERDITNAGPAAQPYKSRHFQSTCRVAG